MTQAAQVYDESKIKTLSSLEHIRMRPGMYIGRLGNGSHQDDGIYILLKEVIDNGVDEYIMGAGKRIDINLQDNGFDELKMQKILMRGGEKDSEDMLFRIHVAGCADNYIP